MNAGALLCPGCRLPMTFATVGPMALGECPACQRAIEAECFPALFRPATAAAAPERLLEEGISSCFYHEQKKAVITCQSCGRFLCSLCDVEFNGRHVCPKCLQSGQARGDIVSLESGRILWDSASLSLCLLPLLLWPLTLLTAPAALACAIYSFNRPGSLVRRTRYMAVLAIALSLLQIAGWVFAFTGGLRWLSRLH